MIGLEADNAGKASYEVIKSLTVNLLSQSHSVIIDSPCMYEELVEFGMNAASVQGAEYRYIECRVEDMRTLESRIEQRDARSSQVQGLDMPFTYKGIARGTRELLSYWESETKRPNSMSSLVLDTTAEDLASCIQKALLGSYSWAAP